MARTVEERRAPGWPGSPARWTSASKNGIGTALGGSAVCFSNRVFALPHWAADELLGRDPAPLGDGPRRARGRDVILAGDIGGTNARLALFETGAGTPSLVALETFASREHRGLEEIVRAFRERHGGPVRAAALGIAGPVAGGRVATTNLPWVVDAGVLARALGLREVVLMNDLEALAWSLGFLPTEAIAELQPGRAGAAGARAVIAAGTGLGEATLAVIGGRGVALASEGGHADFAPRTEVEVALLRWLTARYGRASWERVAPAAAARGRPCTRHPRRSGGARGGGAARGRGRDVSTASAAQPAPDDHGDVGERPRKSHGLHGEGPSTSASPCTCSRRRAGRRRLRSLTPASPRSPRWR
jgi:hypothetical protein